jgi:DNA-binding NtrC family response regulator
MAAKKTGKDKMGGPRNSRRRYRILVVDDEPSVLATYKLILEQSGYDVTASATCREAVEAIRTKDFDLVLSDLALEQQHTAFEVIEAARQRRPTVPSLILTGYAAIEAAEKAEALGISVLYKPIDIEEFLGSTANILRNTYESNKTGTQG